MKKIYIKPDTLVVNILTQQQLLAGSVEVSDDRGSGSGQKMKGYQDNGWSNIWVEYK